MGINLVVIIENSKKISLEEFKEGLLNDQWGKYGWAWPEDDDVWEEFRWKKKRYFTWIFSPRAPYIDIYGTDSDSAEENPYRLLFFKVMRIAEKLAGGPVYVGIDMFHCRLPDDCPHGKFSLPPELDFYWEEWREVADRFDPPEGTNFVY